MASYNHILNNLPEYKHALINALIEGTDLPPYADMTQRMATEAVKEAHDPLLALFEQRDFADIDKIMQLQYDKFGPLNSELFWAVLAHVSAHGVFTADSPLRPIFEQVLHYPSHIPTNAQFRAWHELHATYYKDAIEHFTTLIPEGMRHYERPELEAIFVKALTWSGLADKGWHVEHSSRTNFVSIAKSRKAILLGPSPARISRARLVGLLLHELYIHARWAEHHKGVTDRDTSAEEGIGTLVEQLTLEEFYPLRMYRFLAICFAAGVDGMRRDMRQTFDLIVEVRHSLAPNDDERSVRTFAAKEVVRVFRSLPPDIPGLVYVRDKYYLEHNAVIWSTLTEGTPSMERYTSLVAPWEDL
jgi:hypothetical protein